MQNVETIETSVSAKPTPASELTPRTGRILAFATQGSGGDDEARLKGLLEKLPVEFLDFSKQKKRRSLIQLLGNIKRIKPDLVVMEGTGFAGGLALLISRCFFGIPYVFSSGDAVGAFLSAKYPLGTPFFHAYERLLCQCSSGFVGWTQYLAGRALTLGAPRAMTAAGWAPFPAASRSSEDQRQCIRAELGISPRTVVFGIAGSLTWASRFGYCYGYELISALAQAEHSQVAVLIVGDGDGLPHLKRLAGSRIGQSVFFTGRVKREQVAGYLAAMDVGSLPQSVDGVGSFRYTTKLSEYYAAKLPFITNQIPLSYDLDQGNLWRLPGKSPWDKTFIQGLSALMSQITPEEASARRSEYPTDIGEFNRESQVVRATAFFGDILDNLRRSSPART